MTTSTHAITIDAHINSGAPGSNFGAYGYLEMLSGSTTVRSLLWAPAPPKGHIVISARLTLRVYGASWGSTTLTARRITQTWADSSVTWNNQPPRSTETATLETGVLATGATIEIDITSLAQQAVGGAPWYGIAIDSSATSTRRVYSGNASMAAYRPTITYETAVAVEAPRNLSPGGGLVVSSAAPVLSWDYVSAGSPQAQSRVQVDDAPDFATPIHDSDWTINSAQHYVPTGLALSDATQYWWRVAVRSADGYESGWSAAAAIWRRAKGTASITRPSANLEPVPSLTPAFEWTFPSTFGGGGTWTGSSQWGAIGFVAMPSGASTIGLTTRAGAASTTDGTSFATAAFTPGASRILVAVYSATRSGSQPTTPTVSGHGTWQLLDDLYWDSSSGDRKQVWVFWCLTSSTPSNSAVTFAHGGTTHTGAAWSVIELSGVAISSPLRTGPKASSSGTPGTSADVTFPPVRAANERALVAILNAAGAAVTPSGPNFVEIHDVGHATPDHRLETQWRTTTDDLVIQRLAQRLVYHRPTAQDPWSPVHEEDPQPDYATSWTLPLSSTPQSSSGQFLLRLRLWDQWDRVATPGDPAYAEALRTYVFEAGGSVDPPSNLAVSTSGPVARLTWTHAGPVDYFHVYRDGGLIASYLDPAELSTGGTGYAWDDYGAVMGDEHEWEVAAARAVGGEVVVSAANPTVAASTDAIGIWLLAPSLGYAVPLFDRERIDASHGEDSQVLFPAGRRGPVKITGTIRGMEGSVSGVLIPWDGVTSRQWLERAREIKALPPQAEVRLAVGSYNIPVLLGEMREAQWTESAEEIYSISLGFFQSAGFLV